MAACSSGSSDSSASAQPSAAPQSAASNASGPSGEASSASPVQEALDATVERYGFEGLLYIEKNGETVASMAIGNSESGTPYQPDVPMPVGSMSKQFCSAAVLLLQEQGKLSLDDTLAVYFPEYETGSAITLRQMLSMRSGVPNYNFGPIACVTDDETEEHNTKLILEEIFRQPLTQKPDQGFLYSNGGCLLLANIVEQVSGQKYIDFLREHFFTPLGMTYTGDIQEMRAGAAWAGGASYQRIDLAPGYTKGTGDLLTTGDDVARWIKGLQSGKVLSRESYQMMITNYSPGADQGYGYGFYVPMVDALGHPGAIGSYVAADYFVEKNGLIVFFSTDTVGLGSYPNLIRDLVKDVETAAS